MRAMRSGRRRQGGYYTLFSAAAALTIFGILMASQASQYASQGRDDAAQSAGVMAGQFKNALRAMIAERGTAVSPGTFNGTGWLKQSGSCSGASGSRAYLPCEFPNHLPLGLAYRTTVSVAGGMVRANVSLGIREIGGERYPYLAGVIVATINGASNDHVTPVTQTYHVAESNADGHVSFIVSNGPENNEYMKRDGSVTATGDFNWGNFSIRNVRDIEARDIEARELTLSRGFTAGANSQVSGRLTANSVRSSRFEATNGTHHVSPAGDSRVRSISVDNDINVGRDANVTRDMSVNRNMRAGQDMSVGRDMIFTGTRSEGSSCSGRRIAFNSSGELMRCNNSSNRWQIAGASRNVATVVNRSLGAVGGSTTHPAGTYKLDLVFHCHASGVTAYNFNPVIGNSHSEVLFRTSQSGYHTVHFSMYFPEPLQSSTTRHISVSRTHGSCTGGDGAQLRVIRAHRLI